MGCVWRGFSQSDSEWGQHLTKTPPLHQPSRTFHQGPTVFQPHSIQSFTASPLTSASPKPAHPSYTNCQCRMTIH